MDNENRKVQIDDRALAILVLGLIGLVLTFKTTDVSIMRDIIIAVGSLAVGKIK